jgi:long-chain acyl-CoA synthetase
MAMSITTGYQPQRALIEWAKTAPVKTLPQLFERTAARVPHRSYLTQKKNGQWRTQTYREVRQIVENLACALIGIGVKAEDRVAQISPNRPEWVIADLGILSAAAVHVPIYPTLAPHQVSYILKDAGAHVVMVSGQEHLDKVLSIVDEVPELTHIIVYDGYKLEKKPKKVKVVALKELLDDGAKADDNLRAERKKRADAIKAEDVASLVYTSGTTGEPKGAMLMHGNFVSNCVAGVELMGVREADEELSFLPLCHVFERIVYYCMTYAGSHIIYAESIDQVAANLQEVHPSILPSVPRLYEKIHGRIMENVKKDSAAKQKVFDWALSVGRAVRRHRERNRPMTIALVAAHRIADKLVFAKIRERTGGRIRLFISGGAPLRKEIGEFFADAGFTLIEGYGLTETSPVITFNRPGAERLGTVGQIMPGVEVKIADDGEILARGPNIMRGYFNRPEDTRAAIDEGGWFHTGDIGQFDEDGYLMITDRKKEILVMSNGKNVAPQPIENLLKSSPYIEQAFIIGDNRNFISALVVPAFGALETWAAGKGIRAKGTALAHEPAVLEFLDKHVHELCQELSQYEKVKKIAVLEHEFTQESGELTPTLKFKRRVILDKYKTQIEELYAGSSAGPGG